jgi:hypothetical protein
MWSFEDRTHNGTEASMISSSMWIKIHWCAADGALEGDVCRFQLVSSNFAPLMQNCARAAGIL